jgi:hypothetical protein
MQPLHKIRQHCYRLDLNRLYSIYRQRQTRFFYRNLYAFEIYTICITCSAKLTRLGLATLIIFLQLPIASSLGSVFTNTSNYFERQTKI